MNFFTHQDIARKNTKKLVFFFVLAVISLIILTNLLVFVLFSFANQDSGNSNYVAQSMNWEVIGSISLAVIFVIVAGSLYKVYVLSRGGGDLVAQSLGGHLLTPDNFEHRQVLNVVEEMAIAAGTPVPPVYLIEEQGINAFAAGYSTSDAVIGVTRGAIENFDRDELQGVMAHEFSHIINGDMRLNIKLMGVLHGILLMGLIGYHLMYSGSRRRSKDNGGIVLFGLGLVAIGFAGTFFGKVIKAAVSRQREFLADASAVQYTRNPNGISGALKRLAGYPAGSILKNPKAAEVSHALFGEGLKNSFSKLLATHPPLNERIRRIEADWDPGNEIATQTTGKNFEQSSSLDSDISGNQQPVNMLSSAVGSAMIADSMIAQIGQPTQNHLNYAVQLHQCLSDNLVEASHDPFMARALIYGLLLDKDQSIKQQQLIVVSKQAENGVHSALLKLMSDIENLSTEHRLPLVEMIIPTLRSLSKNQYLNFRENVIRLIELDKKVDLFEWSLQKMLFHHLDIAFHLKKSVKESKTLATLKYSANVLLSFLSYSSSQENMNAAETFHYARGKLSISIDLLSQNDMSLDKLNAALDSLAMLKPSEKEMFIDACARCMTADQTITLSEQELFRAICSSLDCPMPPLLMNG